MPDAAAIVNVNEASAMSSHPREDSSVPKPVVRKTYEHVEEELAARNICRRKHGYSVLHSVPDAFTAQICEQTISFLAGQDLYIPSEVEHARWYLEVIDALMSKHSDQIDQMKRSIEILGRWLLKGFCSQVPVEERCDVFEHVALLLARPLFIRKEIVVSQESIQQVKLINFWQECTQQIKLIVRSSFAWSDLEFARYATVLIGCIHVSYKLENGAPAEGNGSMLFLCFLHELFLRKCAQNDQAWHFLKGAYREWISVPPFVKLWCDWIAALALRVCRIIYGPTEGTTHVTVSCGFNYPVLKIEASDEDVVTMFWKLLHLQGDVVDCSDPQIHNQICEGLSKVFDIFCDVGRKLPPTERGQSHPRTPNPPSVSCMLRLGHEWLFGACVKHLERSDSLFTPGVVRTITSLCRIFSSPSRILVDMESLVKMYDLILALLRQGTPDVVDAIVVGLLPLFLHDNPCTRIILPRLTNSCISFLAPTFKGTPKPEVVKYSAVGIVSCELSLRTSYPISSTTTDSDTLLDTLSTCNVLLAFAKAETSEKCCHRAMWSILLAAFNSISADPILSHKIISLFVDSLPGAHKDWHVSSASIVMAESFFHWVSLFVKFQSNHAPALDLVSNFLRIAPSICHVGLTQPPSRRSACISLTLSTVICSALHDCLTLFPFILRSSSNFSQVLGLARIVFNECTPPSTGAMSLVQATIQKLPSVRPQPQPDSSVASSSTRTQPVSAQRLSVEDKDSKHQAGPDRYNKKIQDDPVQLIDRCRESARNLTWCISTLTGNFPFALGAATFGNVVYEDRLLNVSSDKPPSYSPQQAEGEVGDRLSGKMRVFAFGDGSSGCCGTLSILQTQPEHLQTICRDESGRYAWKWTLHSPISGAPLYTCSSTMSTAKPPALSPSKITHPRKKSEDLCPLLQLLSAVEREDAQSGIDQSPLYFVAVGSEEARRPVTKDSTFILQQLQSSSKIEFDKECLLLQRQRRVGSFSHSPLVSPQASHPSALLGYKAALQSEFLFNLGFASLDGFSRFHPIGVNSKSWRSIVSLDKLFERETHKIGLLYVGRGHQTQKELFHNEKTSSNFERFSQAIGWHVDLEGKHLGFMGGLDPLGSTGKFAPYFANSSAEVLFHVPTMMPTNRQDPQQVHKKRHVGNDHVHIIATEDDYDYRTSTIISQFNDVHIVVRENFHGLFSVHVHAKESIDAFGPLQDSMLVRPEVLPFLVRVTAVQANRKVRLTQVDFKQPQPTRLKLLQELHQRYQPLAQSLPAKFLSSITPNISAADSLLVHNPC